MRTLGISAILLAVGLGALSIIFTGLAYGMGGRAARPARWLKAFAAGLRSWPIPVFATMAWGLMLMLTDRPLGRVGSRCGGLPCVHFCTFLLERIPRCRVVASGDGQQGETRLCRVKNI